MTTIHDTLTLALSRHMAGQFAEAEALYARILDADPDHPGALHLSGMLLGQAGRFDDGLARVGRAATLVPHAADIRINRAVLLDAAGRHAEALDAGRRAMALDPAFAEGWTDLSALVRGAGRTDAAITALDRAVHLNPALETARDRLALLLREKGRLMVDMGRNREALPTLERAAVLAPLDADIAFWQANALHAHGRLDRAVTAYGRAAAVAPDFASALFNLGVTRIHRLELEAGVAVLGWVQRLLPNAEEPRETRLAALVRCGPWDEVQRESNDLMALKARLSDTLPAAPLPAAPRAERLRSIDVVAFSLWGDQPLHTVGAVENARLVPQLYPGWECRVHHDGSVPPAVLDTLAAAGARLVPRPAAGGTRGAAGPRRPPPGRGRCGAPAGGRARQAAPRPTRDWGARRGRRRSGGSALRVSRLPCAAEPAGSGGGARLDRIGAAVPHHARPRAAHRPDAGRHVGRDGRSPAAAGAVDRAFRPLGHRPAAGPPLFAATGVAADPHPCPDP